MSSCPPNSAPGASLKSGRRLDVTSRSATFTHPATPIKCRGSPQKIAYLADEAFRKQGVRDKTNIIIETANATIFQVEAYAKTLRAVVARKRAVSLGHRCLRLRSSIRGRDRLRPGNGRRCCFGFASPCTSRNQRTR